MESPPNPPTRRSLIVYVSWRKEVNVWDQMYRIWVLCDVAFRFKFILPLQKEIEEASFVYGYWSSGRVVDAQTKGHEFKSIVTRPLKFLFICQ